MVERIHVELGELRRAARDHQETADHLSTVPSAHPDILASLESLGPIFGELRDAGRELLEQRRVCYEQQAAAHADLSQNLGRAADAWEQQDTDAARDLRGVAEGGT